jgi:hypothetical protein
MTSRAVRIAQADLSLTIGRRRAADADYDPTLAPLSAEALAAAHEHYRAAGLGRHAAAVARLACRLVRGWVAREHAREPARRRRGAP